MNDRCGTRPGARDHRDRGERPCIPCRLAEARYQNERALDMMAGRPRELSPVGSSRVDLQACKLEYSIVSPK